jgi:nucleotide-binding universal stress UspA family protein
MTSALQHGDIVAGVDGSAVSAAALRWAVTEAARSGRSVRAVRAWSFDPLLDVQFAVAGFADQALATHRRELDTLVHKILDDAEAATVHLELIEDTPAEALIRASRNASMLVLGSHGHGRLLGLIVGSVTAQCLRKATCPVAIIPARTVPESISLLQELATATTPQGPFL